MRTLSSTARLITLSMATPLEDRMLSSWGKRRGQTEGLINGDYVLL